MPPAASVSLSGSAASLAVVWSSAAALAARVSQSVRFACKVSAVTALCTSARQPPPWVNTRFSCATPSRPRPAPSTFALLSAVVPSMMAVTPLFSSAFCQSPSGVVDATAMMASHPAFCNAVICSFAVSVQSRAVMNSPLEAEIFAAWAVSFSAKKPILYPARSTIVYIPLVTRLRFQLVER